MKAKLSRWDEETGRYVRIATIDINAWGEDAMRLLFDHMRDEFGARAVGSDNNRAGRWYFANGDGTEYRADTNDKASKGLRLK